MKDVHWKEIHFAQARVSVCCLRRDEVRGRPRHSTLGACHVTGPLEVRHARHDACKWLGLRWLERLRLWAKVTSNLTSYHGHKRKILTSFLRS